MNKLSAGAILLSVVVCCLAQNNPLWNPGFSDKEFTDGAVFAANDKVVFDMSDYLKNTYELESIQVEPEGLLNYYQIKPNDQTASNVFTTDERDCTKSTLLSHAMDFVMLCGNDGMNLVRIDYDRSLLKAELFFRYQIR